MKRLDLYILSIFVPAFVVMAVGFVGLALLIDAVTRAKDLSDVGSMKFIVQYFALRLPLYARTVLPVVPLFAAGFTVIRLSNSREIVPMITAGANLRRLFLPFLFFALMAGALVAAIEEYALPALAGDLSASDAYLKGRKRSYSVIESDGAGNYLYASEYDHGQQRLRGNVQLLQIPEGGTLEQKVTAQTAEWNEKSQGWVFKEGEIWLFEGGKRVVQPPDSDRRPTSDAIPIPAEGYLVKLDLRPDRIKRGETQDRFATFAEARAGAEGHPDIPFFFARLLDRLTYPLAPLLLLMLGLPFVVGLDEKTHVKGLFLCFVISVVYFGAYLVGQDFAVQGLIPPIYGCWGPPAVFGCVGGALYGIIRT